MGSTHSVSVIIPVYNGERFLAEAVHSALSQTHRDVEVIVVDDGSTDGTPDIISRLGSLVRPLRQPNQGVAAARNAGIAVARGRFVAFLDADDVWLPHKLERQLALLESKPSLGAVGSGFLVTDEQLQTLAEDIPPTCDLAAILLLRTNGGLFSSTMVARTEILSRLGGFDTRLSTSADWDLVARLAAHYEVASVPEALVLYRQHGTNMHGNVPRTEEDMRLAMGKAFTDPQDRRVACLRSRAYSNMFRMLSGSYWYAGNPCGALRCGLLAVRWRPGSLPSLARSFFGRWVTSQKGVFGRRSADASRS
jgi:glycosyltransferase involved in cell wall biosynthesis